MSPENRPSKGARQKIRGLKSETRNQDPTQWENMEKILKMRLPDRDFTSSGYSIIKNWFEIRVESRHKDSRAQDEARTAFFKHHGREKLMEVKDALAIVTQTLDRKF